jgi:hypothetical protein
MSPVVGAETVVDIWLYSGTDSSIPGNDSEVVSTEEGVSGRSSNTSEQLIQAVKVNDCVNGVVSTEENLSGGNSDILEHLARVVEANVGGNSSVLPEVCDLPAKEMLPGLIKPKIERVDDTECIAPCDDESQLDASGHEGCRSSDMLVSSLDHDYFGVMKVEIKNECELEQSVPDFLQENVVEDCSDLCKVKSSVEVDSKVENHLMEVAPVVKENNINCVLRTVEVPTESVTVNNHLEQNLSSTENNSKLTTLVKCMDKNGHVFYLTLGQTHLKPQVNLASVVSTSEQSVNVINSTSLLNKQQSSHTQLCNKVLPTTAVTSGLRVKSPVAKPVFSNYSCKEKDSVIPEGNSCSLVHPHGTAGSAITKSNALDALSLETNPSSLLTSQQTSKLICSPGTNVKPGVKVTSPVLSTNNSSKLLKQLQNSSGQLLSFLKVNATMPTANRLEGGNKDGDSKAYVQNASTPVQDQPFFVVKNEQLYLLKHAQNSATLSPLAGKSSGKKCESIPKQRSILLMESKSLLSGPLWSVKGGVSLLKKQANAQVLENLLTPTTVKLQDVDKSENARLLMSGRCLVLNKANSRHITQSNKIRYGVALR